MEVPTKNTILSTYLANLHVRGKFYFELENSKHF